MKIAVALSGGVDSTVTAAILQRAGHEVFGLTMRVLHSGSPENEAVEQARQVAARLGIPHQVIDLRTVFQKLVIDDFCREYGRGRTPNPCVRCNRYIKFGALWDRARELGAERLATGHYARVEPDETGQRYLLKKGMDPAKDQSYVLYSLTRDQIKHLMLPLGGLSKTAVNEMARDIGLPVSEGQESQEICFIPDGDYAAFLKKQLPAGTTRPGPLVDRMGNIIGQHRGIIYYTVGQRKRLGIATGGPLYVTAIDAASNTIIVGRKEDLYRRDFLVSGLNWLAIDRLHQPQDMEVKIRYRQREAAARLVPETEGCVRVTLREPQPAVTPGQSAVFYRDDTVMGGGIIQ